MVVVDSYFAQILALIDRTDFARTVRQHARRASGLRPIILEIVLFGEPASVDW
jgi:hypothetical protein